MTSKAVIYKSKSGSTKKYAQWIAEEVGADIFEASYVTQDDLLKYDVIVYGGGLYAGRINGIKLINNNRGNLVGKKIIVFGVGATSADKQFGAVKQANKLKDNELFLLRGALDMSKYNFFDRFLMNGLKIALKSKKEQSAEDKELLAAYDVPADWTDKKYIEPIVKDIFAYEGLQIK